MIGTEQVLQAAARIKGHVRQTPVLSSREINIRSGLDLTFKCENFQTTGAFKYRGAVNAVLSLDEAAVRTGVATHSSGNHGAALARAAMIRNIPAHIVVPANARAVKKAAIAGYGADIIECAPTLPAREQVLDQVVAQSGASFVPPYDDDRIIAGQGTAALEFLRQVPDLDALVVPVGGGGLLAGTILATLGEGIRVYGAEPTGADDAWRSVRSGIRVAKHQPDSLCDGLLTTLGARNFDIIGPHVAAIIRVSDAAVVDAMSWIWSRMKIVVEPSAAITRAAVLSHPELIEGQRIGLILSGGNVDLSDLPFQG